MTWLNKPAVRQRLASLADGSAPLTHEGIDKMTGSQGREFLRELLMHIGLLPHRDKYLAAFSTWRHRRLASIEEPVTRNEISAYLAWRHMRNLTVRSQAGQLTAAATAAAHDQTDAAVRFLGFYPSGGSCCPSSVNKTSTTGSPRRPTRPWRRTSSPGRYGGGGVDGSSCPRVGARRRRDIRVPASPKSSHGFLPMRRSPSAITSPGLSSSCSPSR